MWTWTFAPQVRKEFLALPETAQEALVAFLEGVIGDDPLRLRQMAAGTDPGGVLRDLAFGSDGLVSILIVVRGEQVLVVKIIWAGED